MWLLPFAAALAAERVTVLLCEDAEGCARDLATARAALGEEVAIRPVDVLLELDAGGWAAGVDQKARLAAALAAADEAAARRRWAALDAATAEALDALARWPGTVPGELLFRVHFLRGVAALGRGRDQGHAYHFRQAAAVVDGEPPPLPTDDPAVTRAWLDELRKLTVGGRGTLLVTGAPADAEVRVDGRLVEGGSAALWPGNHRVTVVAEGRLATWRAEVPVVAGRATTVAVDLLPTDDAGWVQAELRAAFDRLDAPAPVIDRLADWCAREEADELELLLVVDERQRPPVVPVDISERPAKRPEAADGERVDMGDGVRSTFAEEVVEVHARAGERPVEVARLRVIWFDPRTRRLGAEPAPVDPVPPADPPVRAGAEVGWLTFMDRHHATVEVGLGAPVGPFEIEGRLGLWRADLAYNLRADWVDRQVYPLGAALRWRPPGAVAPWVALGPELVVPVAVGGRLQAGVDARFAGWTARAGGTALLTDAGFGWGLLLGAGR